MVYGKLVNLQSVVVAPLLSLVLYAVFGHRQSGDVWWWADRSGNDDDNETLLRQFLSELEKVDATKDINTYDRVQAIDLDGKGSFMFGTGIYFSYALKHNIVWRIGLDYDFTRARFDYAYTNFSLVELANSYLVDPNYEAEELYSNADGSFHRSLHQLTPHFGICFSF